VGILDGLSISLVALEGVAGVLGITLPFGVPPPP